MDNILMIESTLLNANYNLLNDQILNLKSAILEGDKDKLKEISKKIISIINQ